MTFPALLRCDHCGTRDGNIAARSRACGCILCQGCERFHEHSLVQMLRFPRQGILQ